MRGTKGQLYEGGIRVSALANWPGKLAAGSYDPPLHIVDWMPTLCGLAGYQPDRDLKWDGQNVWPLLTGQQQPAARTLYWLGTGSRTSAVRHGDWKLLVTKESGKAELFDLAHDPYEQQDLAETNPARVAELRQLLETVAVADNDARVSE